MKRFFALRNEISLFMKMKNKAIPLLDDPTFQCSLAFLTDITHHVNELNVKFQGRNQIVTQIYDHEKLFKVILGLWIKHLHEGRDVAAAPQTPQLGGAQANFGGPS